MSYSIFIAYYFRAKIDLYFISSFESEECEMSITCYELRLTYFKPIKIHEKIFLTVQSLYF